MVTLAISCEGIVVISFLPYTSHIFSPLPEGLSHGKTPPLVFSCVCSSRFRTYFAEAQEWPG